MKYKHKYHAVILEMKYKHKYHAAIPEMKYKHKISCRYSQDEI